MRYFARRLFHTIFLIIGVSVLSFLFMELAPGEFFDEMRLNPQISPETIVALRHQYGLDEFLPVRYVRWAQSAFKGEFGFSFAYNRPVAPLLLSRGRNTLLLTLTATFFAWLIGVPWGVWSAARKGRWLDDFSTVVVAALLAVPDLLLALGALLLAARTGWFPVGGMFSLEFSEGGVTYKVKDLASHLFLPALVLVLVGLPTLVRHARTAMIEVLDSGFVRAARAHGIPGHRLLFRHALPAAAGPLISLFGISVGTLLSASLLIEAVMGWPGIGPLLLEAILARDLYLVVGAVMFSTAFLVAGNLVADVLLYRFDPRIRGD
jgi:peptide/nickel transport system permease protein